MGIETVPLRRSFASWRALAALGLLVVALILALFPADALAQDDDSESDVPAERVGGENGFVDVLEVNGLIDPVMVDFINRSLDQSAANGARGIILQMESEGAAVSDADIDTLANRIAEFEIPISVWVGQANNGRALGRAGQLALAADAIGISPGSEIGDFGPMVLTGAAADQPFVEILSSGFDGGVWDYDELRALIGTTGSVDVIDAPAVLLHLLQLPYFDSRFVGPGEELPNGSILADDAQETAIPLTDTRFVTLPLIEQQFHTFASPPVAYLLFIIGLGLLVFELYTAGIGIAGVIGAGCFLAGGYGLAILDARWWAVALLIVSFIGFAIDVQSGIQAFWSGVGVVFLVLGSLLLLPDHSIGWLPLGVGIIGMTMSMLGGMPAMVRTRFSTPTIGREWMIGEVGEVVETVDPEGIVTLRGAPWRARTNRATPIAVGERARVIEVDGLLLEVEPEDGGAVDYRERRKAEHAEAIEAEEAPTGSR